MDVSMLKKGELSAIWPKMDWSEYEEPSPLSFHEAQPALIVFYAVLWVVGAMGNVWVAFVVGYLLVKRRSRRSGDAPLTVQIYIFSLCLCDLLVLAFLPLLLLDLIYGSWKIPSSSLCRFYLLSEGFNKFGAPWLLTALSGFCYSNIQRVTDLETRSGHELSAEVDQRKISSCSTSTTSRSQRKISEGSKRQRAPSVVHRKDSGRKSAFTVLMCALAVILAMCPVFLYADIHYVVVHNETEARILALKCAFQPPQHILTAFTIYSFLAGYLCPAFLFTYYYSAILFFVRRYRRTVHASNLGSRSEQRYCRVTKTAIGLVGWTLAGWTPYWAIFLYFYFHPQTDAETAANASATIVLSYFVHMLPYINCSGYPILYTMLNKNIRTAYVRAKTESVEKRRRKKSALLGGATSSSGGSRRPLRLSHEYSTCEAVTQVGEMVQNEDSFTFYHFDECEQPRRISSAKSV